MTSDVLWILLFLVHVTWVDGSAADTRGPVFLLEPAHKVEFSNSTGAELRCVAEGNPKPQITWKTKEGAVTSDLAGVRYLRPDGTLVFSPFSAQKYRQEVHDSFYYCVASNAAGSIVSRDVQVRGVVYQKYVAQVYDDFVSRRNTAVLRCHLPSFVREYVRVDFWMTSEGVVLKPSDTNVRGMYSVLPSGELLVHEVDDRKSSLTYRCQTRHRLTGDSVLSANSGKLVVTEPHAATPPRITFSHSVVRAHEGDSTSLPCVAQGLPSPTYRWMKESPSGLQPVLEDDRLLQVQGVLIIRRTAKSDGGKYQCVARNSEGERRVDTTLIVSAPLTVYITPTKQVANIGDTATFNCSVKGYPVHTVVWKKDQRHLVSSSRIKLLSRDVLYILSIRREDRGMYQCFVYNDQDSAQGTAELRIGESAPYIVSAFSDKTVYNGEGVSMMCATSGNPLPIIGWRLDGIRLAPSQRVLMGDVVTGQGQKLSHVNITEARIEDGGEYTCEVSNEVGRVLHSARLNVYGPPFVRPIRNVSAVSGENLVIRCAYGGHPIKTVTWQKGGILLPLHPRHKVSLNGSLYIQDVQREADQGEYTCVVRNPEGQSASGSTFLSVVVAPVIDTHFFPERVVADEGSRTKLICSVNKGDPPIRFRWLKDGKPFSAAAVQMVEDSSMIIFRKVTASDHGQYTCVAANAAATSNMTTHLVVNVPPRWKVEPHNTSVVLGKTVWLDCSPEGFPRPNVVWRKGKAEDAPGEFAYVPSESRVRQYSNGTLVLRDVEEEDRGFYVCEAINGVGAGLSKVIYLQIHVPAHFEEHYRSTAVREGLTTSVKCSARGDSPVTITWQRNKENFVIRADSRFAIREETEKDQTTSELIVTSTSRHDSGLYTCFATNQFGSDETSIQFTVQGVPDPPTNVTVFNTTSRTISVFWEVPFTGNSHLTRSVVQYKVDSDTWNDRTPHLTVSGPKTSATLTALNPVTMYHIRILAENAIGSSQPSRTTNATTNVEAPSGPPRDVHVQATGAQSLKVMWKSPKEDQRHGQITGFYVGYRPADSSEAYQLKHVAETGDELSTYVTSLQPFTKYEVVLQAYNPAGSGPRSDPVLGMTLETAPPTSPLLMVTASTATSIDVKWDKDIKDKSTVTEYSVHYKREGGEWKQERLGGEKDHHTIRNLRCGTRYQLYMTSSNSLGTGEPSPPISSRTKGAAPMSPQEADFLTVNSTSVTLHLNTWQSGGCPIQYFSVQYRLKYQRQWTVVFDRVGAPQDKLDVRNLTPDREYSVMITAFSEAGATQGEYHFRTLGAPVVAGTLSPALVKKEADLPFHRNLTLMLPVAASAVVLLLVVLTVAICTRRHSRDRNNRPKCQSRKSCHDALLMAEVNQKAPGKQSLSETHYSSPTQLVAGLVRVTKHEYAEPYSSVPPPRHITSKEDFRTAVEVQRHLNDGAFATIKRYPTRPASLSSQAYKQAFDVRVNSQMVVAQDKIDYSSNSSHSEASAEKPSSQSSESQKPFTVK